MHVHVSEGVPIVNHLYFYRSVNIIMKKPNIIFIFSDQQRFDTIGCYNDKINFTPNLDQLAATGVKFENAFTCQPVCGPARACLQTGLYATQTGCYRNNIALPKGITTIADRFNSHNYETAYIGKWHLASNGGESSDDIGESFNYRTEAVPVELRGGYKDYWMAADVLEFTSKGYGGYVYDIDNNKIEFSGYRPDCLTDYAVDYISHRKTDNPFFLFISYLEPHHQNDANHFQGPHGSKEKFKDADIPDDLKPFKGDWGEEYPDYLGCCESLDMNVGRIVNTLKKLNIFDDTLIIYTSDHGSHFRTRNGEYKRSCHDSSIHIPLIMHGPGFTSGKNIDDMVSLIDLPVTILTCAGIEPANEIQGRPLQKSAAGDNENWKQNIFLQISESQVGRAVRTKKWKYSVSAPDKKGGRDSKSDVYKEEFLYDLENDPNEFDNLIQNPEYEPIRADLQKILIYNMQTAGEKIPVII